MSIFYICFVTLYFQLLLLSNLLVTAYEDSTLLTLIRHGPDTFCPAVTLPTDFLSLNY